MTIDKDNSDGISYRILERRLEDRAPLEKIKWLGSRADDYFNVIERVLNAVKIVRKCK